MKISPPRDQNGRHLDQWFSRSPDLEIENNRRDQLGGSSFSDMQIAWLRPGKNHRPAALFNKGEAGNSAAHSSFNSGFHSRRG